MIRMAKRGWARANTVRKAGGGVTWHLCSEAGVPKCNAGKKSYHTGNLSEVVWSESAPGIVCNKCIYGKL